MNSAKYLILRLGDRLANYGFELMEALLLLLDRSFLLNNRHATNYFVFRLDLKVETTPALTEVLLLNLRDDR